MFFNLYNFVLPIFNIIGIMITKNSTTELTTLSPNSHVMDFMLTTTGLPDFQNDTTAIQTRSLLGKILGFTAFTSLSITGIAGNGLVIYAIFTDPAVQAQNQISNLAILNLAYSDIMTASILCIPASICIWFEQYPLGDIWCLIWSIFNLTGIVATMGLLMVVSLDRFVAVGWSLHYPTYVTYNRLQGACLFVWAYTMTCTCCWGLFDFEYEFNTGVCDFTWAKFGPDVPSAFYYGLFCTIVVCLIPSGLILFCNIAIINMSKEKGRAVKVQDSSAPAGDSGGKDKKQESKVNARILKAMVIVIASYFILTFPVAFIRVVKVLSGPNGPAKHIPSWLTLICQFLQFSASIVNPLIYGLLRKDFQEAYRRIWKRIIGG